VIQLEHFVTGYVIQWDFCVAGYAVHLQYHEVLNQGFETLIIIQPHYYNNKLIYLSDEPPLKKGP
jgi:hypothetical protein